MYYSKIIKKIILRKYAIILCGHTKNLFKTNYYFMNSFYSSNCFTDINILIIAIKKIIPLLMSILKKRNLLFIGTRFLYSKTISNSIFLSHKLVIRKPGIFSNFSITSFYSMYKVALKKIPNVIFFFYLK